MVLFNSIFTGRRKLQTKRSSFLKNDKSVFQDLRNITLTVIDIMGSDRLNDTECLKICMSTRASHAGSTKYQVLTGYLRNGGISFFSDGKAG